MGCNRGFEPGNYLVSFYRGSLFRQISTTHMCECALKFPHIHPKQHAAGVKPSSKSPPTTGGAYNSDRCIPVRSCMSAASREKQGHLLTYIDSRHTVWLVMHRGEALKSHYDDKIRHHQLLCNLVHQSISTFCK